MSILCRDSLFNDFLSIYPLTSRRCGAVTDGDNGYMRNVSLFCGLDLHESDKEYEVLMDVPGMDKSDIKLSLNDHCLSIEGKRESVNEERDEKGRYHMRERCYGNFHREVNIPFDCNTDELSACYDNGVLRIVIPKKVTSKKRDIVVV